MTIKIERPSQFEATWIEQQDSEAYHADKTAVSSSVLKTILKSPASFYSQFLEGKEETNDAFRLGSAVHMALLEPKKFFHYYLKQPDFGDQRSSKNREKKEEWMKAQAPKAIILNEAEYIRIEGMINSVMKHPDASNLLKGGQPEISGYYCDPETNIKCRIKPDFINFDLMMMIDVKTTQDCTRDAFIRSILKYQYDFQLAMYGEGTRLITGQSVNHFIFLAIEKDPPYEVGVYLCEESILNKGRNDYRRALDLLSDCLEKNHWPGYQASFESLGLPGWAIKSLGEITQ